MDLLQWERLNRRLDDLALTLAALRSDMGAFRNEVRQQGAKIMSAMDDLETKLMGVETAEDAVTALLGTIHQELADILASGVTPARVQALADRLDADQAKLAAAAAANPDPGAPAP